MTLPGRMRSGIRGEPGFSLVELMVTLAIIAVLSAVAVPAYINQKNRAIQTEAVEALMRAKMEQEIYWAENNQYATNIGCLASFGNNCAVASTNTPSGYRIAISSASANTFTISAQKTVNGKVDTLTVADTSSFPVVSNPAALEFSLFEWAFKDH